MKASLHFRVPRAHHWRPHRASLLQCTPFLPPSLPLSAGYYCPVHAQVFQVVSSSLSIVFSKTLSLRPSRQCERPSFTPTQSNAQN